MEDLQSNAGTFNISDAEYVPLDLLYKFISESLPGIHVIKMQSPVILDDSQKYMYVAKSALIGYEIDGEQIIANNCLEYLAQEITKGNYKSVGIYGLFSNKNLRRITNMQGVSEIEKTDSNTVVLRYAFPELIEDEINKIEEPYQPQYTKHVRPFHYDQDELLKRIKEND